MSKYNAVVEEFRSLVSVVVVDRISPIKKADRIELAHVGGWQVVVKKGEFQPGDHALYCEIDSLLPTSQPIFEFLKSRKESLKTYDGIEYSHIRTIKLRGEISQGLLVSVPTKVPSTSGYLGDLEVGSNLTNVLGVRKLEEATLVAEGFDSSLDSDGGTWFDALVRVIAGPPVESQLRPWPSALSKSSQPRVQNIHNRYMTALNNEETFEVSVKLDGSSMTVFSLADRTGVCQRNNEVSVDDIEFTWEQTIRRFIAQNLMAIRDGFKSMWRTTKWLLGKVRLQELTRKEAVNEFFDKTYFYFREPVRVIYARDNVYVRKALGDCIMDRIERYNKKHNTLITVQGELIGPGIQENYEEVENTMFLVYQVYRNGSQVVLPEEARAITLELGLSYIPVLDEHRLLPETIQECLDSATGQKHFTKSGFREGLVYKSNSSDLSFKVISNEYLLNKESIEE